MATSSRVSADDLEWGATWLEQYNDGEDLQADGEACEEVLVARRVAEWLRAEAERRHEDAAVRRLAKEAGTTIKRARQGYRRYLAKQGADR